MSQSHGGNGALKCVWPAKVEVTYTTTPEFKGDVYGEPLLGEPITLRFIVNFPYRKVYIVEAKCGKEVIPINGTSTFPIELPNNVTVKCDNINATSTKEGMNDVGIAFSESGNKIYFTGGKLKKPISTGDNPNEIMEYSLEGVTLFQWNPCPQ